ncbi:MAG TPA: LCP family protein [Candidatus Limnocylindrales bacterium]
MDKNTPTSRGRGRSPSLAALLSFIWPGLGQFYLGRRRAAAILATPAILILVILAYELRQGVVVFGARFVDPAFSLAVIAVVIVAGLWRLVAVANVLAGGKRRRSSMVFDELVVIALAALIVISHAGAGYLLAVTTDAGSQAFNQDGSDLLDSESGNAGDLPTPASADSRVTILFTGVDAASSRSEHLYDSIMVVSFDPKTNSIQMISVPRDTASFPFYFGGVDKASTKINSIPTYVRNGWIKSPDSPYMTLVKEVGYLVGISINYYAVMDLGGFAKMIDTVGGIDVVNPAAINDGTYDWLNGAPYGFYLAAGPQHLDGKHALAYVRSRHGSDGTAGNSDYKRADRQQQVLIALLRKMAQPAEIPTLPRLISTLGASVTTDFPANKVADYVAMGQSVPSGNIKQVVLAPPTYSVTGISNVTSSTCLINAKVAALSIEWFGSDSTWNGKPAPANTCP